jgi:transposase
MSRSAADLPDDVEMLRAIIAAQARQLADQAERLQSRETLIEKLKAQLAVLRRARFGASSEKIERTIAQLELALEDIEAAAAEVAPPTLPVQEAAPKAKPARQPLPDHLPRHEVVHEAGDCACPTCGGRDFLKAGAAVSEMLDYVPASFRVLRHVQPRLVCKGCDTEITAAMPSAPIERGKPSPGLIAHVLTAKYCDHLPLYRQSEIYAREGIDLARSTMADWVGRASALLAPLVAALRSHVFAGDRLHGDDTPVPVLQPGLGKTKTGRLWIYVRDGRPCADRAPPAVCYFYSPDRKGEHPRAHLKAFRGILHADGYAGFKELYETRKSGEASAIQEAACMAHVRRKFFDLTTSPAPIAEEAAAADRRALRYREDHPRITTRAAPRGAPGAEPAALCGFAEMAGRDPDRAAAQIRHRGGHPLRPGALASARPLHRRRHRRDRQQRRRALDPAHRAWAQELALRRLRQGR